MLKLYCTFENYSDEPAEGKRVLTQIEVDEFEISRSWSPEFLRIVWAELLSALHPIPGGRIEQSCKRLHLSRQTG